MKESLFQPDGTAADGSDARADLDDAWPLNLGAKVDFEAGDDEGAASLDERRRRIVKQLDAAGFEQRREHGVVDVSLTIGVRVANFLQRSPGKSAMLISSVIGDFPVSVALSAVRRRAPQGVTQSFTPCQGGGVNWIARFP